VRSLSLRARILLISSTLLVLLTAATLAFVGTQATSYVNERLVDDLRRSQDLIASVQRDRLARLQLAAQVVASFPQLNALAGTDAATIHDFLLEYAKRNEFAELLILFDPAGNVLARTDTLATEAIPDVNERWLQPALANRVATGLLATTRGVYQVAVTPAEAGGTIFGFLLAGAPIQNTYARALSDVSHTEIVVLGPGRVLGSTLRQDELPWRSQRAWRDAYGTAPGPHVAMVAGERYAAMATPSAGGASDTRGGDSGGAGDAGDADALDALTVVSLQSRDKAIAPYRRIQMGLVLLGLIAAAVGVTGSAVLARSITAPIAKLAEGTREVAAGNFDFKMNVSRRDEIGDLAESFNQMTQGLRERADMQKFVSQSTVEMIQGRTQQTSAGERRVMTMLFSDIRGFTTFSERRSPEEVVSMLNRCLSLQADLVRKFGGDVDKYVGDAVFAHFAGPDMVLNAIRCGVEIHRALDAMNASSAEEPLTVGIGIVTGEAILGSIGSADRLDYTAIGSNVNLSARLCERAKAKEILMSESAWREVRDLVAAEPVEPLDIKGFSEPIAAWRMTVR
jgi:class 3 adenylate cyclase